MNKYESSFILMEKKLILYKDMTNEEYMDPTKYRGIIDNYDMSLK